MNDLTHTSKLNKHTNLLLLARSAFGFSQDSGVSGYLRLPLTAEEGSSAKPVWRMLLELTGKNRGLLPFEIVADVVIGRGEDGPDAPDLDVSALNAVEHGVSRRHALLRPTANHLHIIDLGSTNGTFINGYPLIGKAHSLIKGDHISLGKLNMSVLSLEMIPGTVAPPDTDELPPPPIALPSSNGTTTERLPKEEIEAEKEKVEVKK